MKILKFDLFVEARFFDLVNLKNNVGVSNVEQTIKNFQEMEFDSSKELIKHIKLDNKMGDEVIKMKIEWNNSASHNLIKRISNRTSFISVEEFNEYFKNIINKLFPQEVGKIFFKSGIYSLYDKEHNMTIVIYIDTIAFTEKGRYKIKVLTVLPGRKEKDNTTVKIIDI